MVCILFFIFTFILENEWPFGYMKLVFCFSFLHKRRNGRFGTGIYNASMFKKFYSQNLFSLWQNLEVISST